MDKNLLAAVMMNSNKVSVIDLRYPMAVYQELNGHSDFVNCVSWAPDSKYFVIIIVFIYQLLETMLKFLFGI